MKKLFLIYSLVIISHHQNLDGAISAKNFFINEKHIPERFIKIQKGDRSCQKNTTEKDALVHFCLDENENLHVLKMDRENYQKIFLTY